MFLNQILNVPVTGYHLKQKSLSKEVVGAASPLTWLFSQVRFILTRTFLVQISPQISNLTAFQLNRFSH